MLRQQLQFPPSWRSVRQACSRTMRTSATPGICSLGSQSAGSFRQIRQAIWSCGVSYKESFPGSDGRPRLSFSASHFHGKLINDHLSSVPGEFTSFPPTKLSFESGNLAVAQCDNPNQYTLLAAWQQKVMPPESGCVHCLSEVDVDANTDGYTQWFYFAVRGGTVSSKINFRLINMAKSSSLFGTSPARHCSIGVRHCVGRICKAIRACDR